MNESTVLEWWRRVVGGTVVAAALLILLSATSAHAEVTRVVLAVDGLACPFCAYGLEKQIRRWDAVQDYEIKLKSGLVWVDAKPDKTLRLDHFASVIRKAGFTHGDGQLFARGTLEQRDGRWLLKTADQQIFALEDAGESLRGAAGKTVLVRGTFDADQVTAARPVLRDVERVAENSP